MKHSEGSSAVRSVPMQHLLAETSGCHYPDCTDSSVVTCRRCHQGFCLQHVHRQWGKYICEFCFLLEQAQGARQKRVKRLVTLVCVLLSMSGVLLLLLGWNNGLALTLIVGGISAVGAVATSWRILPRPTRASDIDADTDLRRIFGDRDDQ